MSKLARDKFSVIYMSLDIMALPAWRVVFYFYIDYEDWTNENISMPLLLNIVVTQKFWRMCWFVYCCRDVVAQDDYYLVSKLFNISREFLALINASVEKHAEIRFIFMFTLRHPGCLSTDGFSSKFLTFPTLNLSKT